MTALISKDCISFTSPPKPALQLRLFWFSPRTPCPAHALLLKVHPSTMRSAAWSREKCEAAICSMLMIFQNHHRMVEVRRDLWGPSSPTPLPKQGHLQQAAQDLVQAGLGYLQSRRLHSLPAQRVPVLHHPQSEEVLPHVQLEPPMLQFVPVAPCPVAGRY